jgi:serine protease
MKNCQVIIAGVCALILGAVAVNTQADTSRYIVQFKDDGERGGNRALAGAGTDIKLNLSQVNAVAAEIPERALRGLRNNPNIEYIEIDPKRYPASLRTSEFVTYGISLVQADQVAYMGDKKVCIIDSGYSLGHPDLQCHPNINGSDGAPLWALG